MPEINEIKFTGDLKELLKDLMNVKPAPTDYIDKTKKTNNLHGNSRPPATQLSADVNAKALVYIINTLSSIDNKCATLTNEIFTLKTELQESQKKIASQSEEIEELKTTNKLLIQQLNHTESKARSNAVVLSGLLINASNKQSPRVLRDQAVQHIKNVYNFDLPVQEISNCERVWSKERSNDKIILSLTNNFVKSDLITKVIRTDKRNGVNLNVDEYLSQYHANLLYQLRTLRKTNPNKIFACFSRNGRIFYKVRKDSKPTLISAPDDVTALANELAQYGTLVRRLSHGNSTQGQQGSDRTLRSSSASANNVTTYADVTAN